MTASGRFARRLGPLRSPTFARFWLAGGVSEAGDWLLLVGLPVYVLQVTGSNLVTSLVFLLGLLPTLVIGPLSGVLVDRWDRRRLMVGVSLLQAAGLLPLLLVRGPDDLWLIYVVTAVEAALGALIEPARAAIVADIVPRDELVSAGGLMALTANLARLVGGPLGGLAVEVGGLAAIVAADAVTFLVAALLMARPFVKTRDRANAAVGAAPAGADVPTHPGFVRQLLDGFAEVRADRRLVGVLAVATLASVAQGIFVVLFVVFVIDRLGGGGAEVGLLRGVQAIGGLAGGLVLGVLGRRLLPHRLVSVSIVAFGLVDLAIWNAPMLTTALPVFVGLFIAAGVPGIVSWTALSAYVQQIVPERLLGRVFSLVFMVGGAGQAAGMLIAGLLPGVVGLMPVLNGQALLYVVAGLLAARWLLPSEQAENPAAQQRDEQEARRNGDDDRRGEHGV
jgi:MFS family permease